MANLLVRRPWSRRAVLAPFRRPIPWTEPTWLAVPDSATCAAVKPAVDAGRKSSLRSVGVIGRGNPEMRAAALTSGSLTRLFLPFAILWLSGSLAAERPLVDTKSAGTGSNVSRAELDRQPAGRRIEDIIKQIPGAVEERINTGGPRSGNVVSITGSLGNSNLYLVDGVTVNGQPTAGVVIGDAVQEISVVSSPLSAEYGRLAGGVLNIFPKGDGKETSAVLRSIFINDEPATSASKKVAGGAGEGFPATLGGPLVKDRSWIFFAGSALNNKAGQFAVFNNSAQNKYSLLSGDRQAILGPGQTVTFDLPKFGGFNVFDTVGDVRNLNYGSGRDDGILSPDWAKDKSFTFHGSGERGLLTYNTDFASRQDVNRWGDYSSSRPADKAVNYFLTTGSLGRNDLKIPYESFYSYGGPPSSPPTPPTDIIKIVNQVLESESRRSSGATNYNSNFINDSWRLNDKWSFKLGVRYEKVADAGESISLGDGSAWRAGVSFQDKIPSRLNFDPLRDGNYVLQTSYGDYVPKGLRESIQPGTKIMGMNGGVNFTGIVGTGQNGGPTVYQPYISLSQDFYSAGSCRPLPDNWSLGYGNASWTKTATPKLGSFQIGGGCGYRLSLGSYDFSRYSGDEQLRDTFGKYAGYQPITGLNQVFRNIDEFTLPAHVALPAQQAARLPNDAYFHSRDSVKKGVEDQWGLKRIGFKAAGRDGKGLLWPKQATPVIVAVVDSGVDIGHPDLQRQLWANFKETPNNGKDDDGNGLTDDIFGWNFVDWNNDVRDHHGHGTFVSGIVAAAPDNALGIAGVNPWARIMPVKVAGFTGDSSNVRIAMGVSYAARMGAKVINVSLSGKGDSKAVRAAVDEAVALGALVVVAAGNDAGDVKDAFPGNTPGVITVAATGPDDRRAGYSNFGDRIDVAAPGSDILSLRAAGTDFLRLELRDYKAGASIVNGILYHSSGTSFAAPHVAGVASLLFSINPKLTAEQVRRMILNSARDIDAPGVDRNTGYGRLDAAAALAADPAFFIETAIADVAPAQGAGGTVVRVTGTADASEFARAWVELGAGADPREFTPAGAEIGQAVRNGTLTDIPASSFQGSKEWVLRLITEHRNGQRRENRFVLKLG